ncbi:MAG: glycosyltransferase [Verrucomicrobiota bacterium]
MMDKPQPVDRIVVLVATYQRDDFLSRLFGSLENQTQSIYAVVVSDNAASESTRTLVCRQYRFETKYLALPENPGCGSGLAHAMRKACELWGSDLIFLIFDDDAVPEKDAVSLLYEGMKDEEALLVAPMLVKKDGSRDGGPELKSFSLNRMLKSNTSPVDARRLLSGMHPEFIWCKGPAMMVSHQAVKMCGMHREDMWMLGEDIEYSMRLSAAGRCVFVPEATVHHLPPPPRTDEGGHRKHMIKFLAMVQNLAFMGVCLAHARKCLTYLPSHILRYLITFRSFYDWGYLVRALWNGAVRHEPAGKPSGKNWRDNVMVKFGLD